MIEIYELRQFVAFAECGTLSEAAEILHLSQPALSRNMKKLEADLGVLLFERKKNRLELNENGKYLADLAKEVLDLNESMAMKIQDFARKNQTIALGVCAPAPNWIITPLISSIYPSKTIQTETKDKETLISGLMRGTYQLIVLPEKIENGSFYARECGQEKLMFALPKGHRYARRKSLSFAEMNGENMLLMNDIGFWDFVRREKMPDSRFLIQNDRFSFNELVSASTLPAFTTDLADRFLGISEGRTEIPVSDPEASVTYYLICLKQSQKEYQRLFSSCSASASPRQT